MADSNAVLDALIMNAASHEWQKTAMVISKVFEAPSFNGEENTAQDLGKRIIALIDIEKLQSTGNPRRWRDSSVRLAEKK